MIKLWSMGIEIPNTISYIESSFEDAELCVFDVDIAGQYLEKMDEREGVIIATDLNIEIDKRILMLQKPCSIKEIECCIMNKIHKIKMNRTRNEFIASVNHELKTPLNAIMGFTDLIMDNPEEMNSQLNIIKTQSKRMERLIKNLIYLHSSDEVLSMSFMKLNKLIEKIQGNLKNYFDAEDVKRVSWKIEGDAMILADLNKLSMAIENVIGNAIFFSKDRMAPVLVNIEVDKELKIRVDDQGIGIPMESVDFIFDQFYRAEDASRSMVGLGIGLTITKQILDKHKAKIYFDSNLGSGSSFFIDVPLKGAA